MSTKAYKNKSEAEKAAAYTEKFYVYAHRIEKEKLLYFSLVYRQTTVIITAPADNKAQKEFLGYDWSNRKGNEGIQIITPGGKMYDDSNRKAEGTLASAIRSSFNNDTPTFEGEQADYAKVVHTKDMLDFSRVAFNKSIRLTVDKTVVIKSKYSLQLLGNICNIMIGGTPSRKISKYFTGEIYGFLSQKCRDKKSLTQKRKSQMKQCLNLM